MKYFILLGHSQMCPDNTFCLKLQTPSLLLPFLPPQLVCHLSLDGLQLFALVLSCLLIQHQQTEGTNFSDSPLCCSGSKNNDVPYMSDAQKEIRLLSDYRGMAQPTYQGLRRLASLMSKAYKMLKEQKRKNGNDYAIFRARRICDSLLIKTVRCQVTERNFSLITYFFS